jgi:hypothetical protein
MIDHTQISETNEKVLKAILEDDNDTVSGIASVIRENWNKNTLNEFIYQLLDGDKELIEMIQEWDFNSMKKER